MLAGVRDGFSDMPSGTNTTEASCAKLRWASWHYARLLECKCKHQSTERANRDEEASLSCGSLTFAVFPDMQPQGPPLQPSKYLLLARGALCETAPQKTTVPIKPWPFCECCASGASAASIPNEPLQNSLVTPIRAIGP